LFPLFRSQFATSPKAQESKPYKATRRTTVMSAPVTVSKDWEPPFYEKTADEHRKIKKSISRNFLFAHLEEKDLIVLINAMKLVDFRAGENIINQGEGKVEQSSRTVV